jgi:hypothetical protein
MKKPRTRKPKPDPWEHSLTCPLPPSSSYQLLDTLRQNVLAYLAWVTNDLVRGDLEGALREIQRCADRLTRITAMIPAALETAINDDLQRQQQQAEADREAQLKKAK